MTSRYRDSTALHESAHAAVSHILGETIGYLELLSDREGTAMPLHSPCPLCGSAVPEFSACQRCLDYYSGNDPESDPTSRSIERRYRIEAAVAFAGEIAETKFGNGEILASDEELEGDRDRVRTRASLRHLYREPCSKYCAPTSDCVVCADAAVELRGAVERLMDRKSVWQATTVLAEELKLRNRISGAEVCSILERAGLAFACDDIDAVWPPLSTDAARR